MSLPPWLKMKALYSGIVVTSAVIAGIVGWTARDYFVQPAFHSVREASPGFNLISPFLYLEVPESTLPEFRFFKSDLERTISDMQRAGKVSAVSVYVRDLGTGQWISVNPDEKFALASMLKVVTVMTVLHQAEANPDTIARSVTISPSVKVESEPQAYYPPENPIQNGVAYTMEQLFWHDLVESDNRAENALEAYIGVDTMKKTFADLRLPVPPDTTTDADTTIEYSHLFRVLYGATYLSRENSQALLDLLSRTTFTAGLVAGVPVGTTVAHKFGENLVPISDEPGAPIQKELHDCGIVYYPGSPYLICITTKGTDFDSLATVIRDLSAVAWRNQEKIHEKK